MRERDSILGKCYLTFNNGAINGEMAGKLNFFKKPASDYEKRRRQIFKKM